MKLMDIVVKDAIITELKASKRDEVIAEMVDALVTSGCVTEDQRVDFTKSIIRRENKGSTGFGHGVAVPHVKHADIKTMRIAIGNSAEGIDFKALDREPVYSIVLLLSPEDQPENHLDAMEAIFSSLSQDTFRRFLRQANSSDDVLTLLTETDNAVR
ncbi:MAG: PTS fructose transporter subunit IIA [Phycisphaerae bacterium]|jgi:PTS system fructose-specific IIA component/PTS system nitrogen regulatory IIA component|nr:PTS fructose transporter subunit IIA [Phycisphaerae bacterium]|tara:strand:+ start:1170 stop:1640 length:471 start_codon:yes stop_codon:yes gene_type:complete